MTKLMQCRSAYNDAFRPPIHPGSRDSDELSFEVYRDRMSTGLPEGLTVAKCDRGSYEYKGSTQHFNFTEYAMPEAGSLRSFHEASLSEGVVLPIGGKRYRVQVLGVLGGDDEGYPRAEQRRVLFEETNEAETPFETWSNDFLVTQRIKEIEANLAENHQAYIEADHDETEFLADIKEDSERLRKDLESHRNGTAAYKCNAPVVAFGQPQFVQGAVYPVKDGRCAMHLMTLNTGWGDSGNEVILFTVDPETGEPNAVFHEASCC